MSTTVDVKRGRPDSGRAKIRTVDLEVFEKNLRDYIGPAGRGEQLAVTHCGKVVLFLSSGKITKAQQKANDAVVARVLREIESVEKSTEKPDGSWLE